MLAIIPARGGSKGLPGKNIKLLAGKPLIAYAIEEALKVEAITKVYVSTDDPEIAQIARDYGAECDELRPDHLASDTAKSIDVYNFLLDKFNKAGLYYTEFVVLQPTSPFRKAEHIKEAIAMFNEKSADSVVSYCEEHHPIVWHKYINEEGKFENIFDERVANRQDELPTYYPTGAIYIFKASLIREGIYYTENSYAYLMPRKYSLDIDTLEDFQYAEYFLSAKTD